MVMFCLSLLYCTKIFNGEGFDQIDGQRLNINILSMPGSVIVFLFAFWTIWNWQYLLVTALVLNSSLPYTGFSYPQGLIHEVFTKVLRGLSGAKVTRPGSFRSCQDGYAVKSSLKAEDGLLYPLEKGFFFLPKPPTLILHEEV